PLGLVEEPEIPRRVLRHRAGPVSFRSGSWRSPRSRAACRQKGDHRVSFRSGSWRSPRSGREGRQAGRVSFIPLGLVEEPEILAESVSTVAIVFHSARARGGARDPSRSVSRSPERAFHSARARGGARDGTAR